MTVFYALLICAALMLAYALGYRSGVAYCARQMKPLAKMAREAADLLQNRRNRQP